MTPLESKYSRNIVTILMEKGEDTLKHATRLVNVSISITLGVTHENLG